MAFYFSNHPFVEYDITDTDIFQVVQNPLLRLRIKPLVENTRWVFYEYDIKEGQRAEDIAYNYYGDERYHWVIYITNNIIDPKYDWPLDGPTFQDYIIKKYGSLRNASNETVTTNIHAYEWIVRAQSVNVDGVIIPEKYLVVSEAEYNTLLPAERRIIRNFEYESRLNEDKRSIRLLRKDYLRQFVNEARVLIQS